MTIVNNNDLNILEKKIKTINDLTKPKNKKTLTPEIKKRISFKINEILGKLGCLSNTTKIEDELITNNVINKLLLNENKKCDLLKNRCHRIIEKINN